ncbi:MarR family winged helix-turn-helix transcriptional regulator [Microbacterium allomyrinae]|uniref:MarR family transcriptional regulator n=1 Tax=Microbacterium allomyrinae TaxID=2830666 RepID=A0A9X1LWQ0_9MICO|nr:MarR family transcriptional regulator [Microbacterium allomyrinae]MCC2033153.1 MarR family transcriptional regulator [Microbacterium allomyrinae]
MTQPDGMRPQAMPPRRLAELPSWLLSRAAGVGAAVVGDALAVHGMRRHHFSVLHSLAENGSVSQAELGRRLGIDRSDLHAVLRELEASGLIVQAPDERDRRRNTVSITSRGHARLGELDDAIDGAQRELLARLDDAEQAELSRLLRTLLGPAIGGSES